MSNINHQVEWVNNHKILLLPDFDAIVYRNAKSGKKRRALKFFRKSDYSSNRFRNCLHQYYNRLKVTYHNNDIQRWFREAHVSITCPLVWFFSPKNSKQNPINNIRYFS